MSSSIVAVITVSFALGMITPVLGQPAKGRWKPEPDHVYLQEVARQVRSDSPVQAIAVFDGKVYAGLAGGVRLLDGKALVGCGGPHQAVRTLKTIGDALFAVTESGLHRLQRGKWQRLADGLFQDVCGHLDGVCVAEARNLHMLEGDRLVPIPGAADAPRDIMRIASYSETVYCLGSGWLALFDGRRYDGVNVMDWGTLPSKMTRDLLALGSRLYVATDSGLGLLRGMSMTQIKGVDGLCYEGTTCLAEGFDSDMWIGTPRGAIRMTDGQFHYFAGKRWLPHDAVNGIACADRAVYIATDAGVGIIEYEPYTLHKKAAYYERWLAEWGQKRLGFVHKLEWDDATGTWMREVSDNDGGWTAHYLAAQCFKYAVTGDETARAEAVNSFRALEWCEQASTIDGFPARAIWAKGETGHKAKGGSGGFAAEWHDTADGKFEWKADTSSDEVDAIFYATAIFHDLVAKGKEKDRAKTHLRRIATHIIDNGWVLRDLDGKPTVWARWDPAYFSSKRGYHALGLNGMEVLGYMKTAHALAGDAKFDQAYKKLIQMGYLKEVVRQKLVDVPPDDCPPDQKLRNKLRLPLHGVCDFDDRLAFFHYWLLGEYETDPKLRSVYMRSLERSWGIKRIEHSPWANFIYGAQTGNDCEVDQAVRHLREWPLDMIKYTHRNSHRHDLATKPGYVNYVGRTRAISPRESNPRRWSDSGLNYDANNGGREVEDPSGWLEAYWMGRHFGFIEAPKTKNPAVLTVERRGLRLGAAPYDGPPRP